MPVCPKCHEKNPKLGAKCPRDGFYFIEEGALEQAEDDPRIGKLTADKFVIVDLISEGGMGAVYKAMQLPVEREVAVKVLRAELEDSDQGRDRFIREARAVSKLTHPNVITLHDFGFEDSGHPYMVMEYAPGLSLASWLGQSNLTVPRIIHVIQQILSALSDAHKRGIVHRDLKPENLIVTRTGNDEDYIKLLDFGIARLVNEGATRGLTREGEVFGTPHYMSPEQAQGSTDIGPPADVYALGIISYELFTGAPPFDASTPLSVLYMHINDDLPTMRPRPGLEPPDAVMHMIENATHKDPQDRYQTAGEMLADLNRRLVEEGAAGGLPYATSASQSGQFPRSTPANTEPAAAADESGSRSSSGETVVLDDIAEEDGEDGDEKTSPPAPASDDRNSTTHPTWANPPERKLHTQQSVQNSEEDRRRVIMVAVGLLVFVLTIGVATAFFFGGDDAGAGPEASDQTSNTAEGAQPAESDAPPSEPASVANKASGDEAKPEDEAADNASATDDGSDESGQESNDEPNETLDFAADEANEPPDDERAARADDGEPESAPSEPKPRRESKPSVPRLESRSGADESKDEPEKFEEPTKFRPAKKSDDQSEDEPDDEPDDEPEKFEEPTKFRPAKKSDDQSDDEPDDEPEKFEPAKWR